MKLGLSKKLAVMHALRKTAERYTRSHNPRDKAQGETLDLIANAVYSDQTEDALLRFDALHQNIKTALPFNVLDYFNKAEEYVDL